MGLVDQLKAYAALGRGELRGIYQERKKEIEAKAELKRRQAKTRIEAAKVKADKAKEMADLEAAMYQAEIDQQLAEEQAKQLRHRAGHYTVSERFGRFVSDASKVSSSFVRGLREEPKRTRRTTKRVTSTTQKPKRRVVKKTVNKKTVKQKAGRK